LVNVRGAVVCKEKCDPSVSVTLVKQADKRNEERKTISLTSERSEFLFSDVIPGKYRLEVCLLFHAPILFVVCISRIPLVLCFNA